MGRVLKKNHVRCTKTRAHIIVRHNKAEDAREEAWSGPGSTLESAHFGVAEARADAWPPVGVVHAVLEPHWEVGNPILLVADGRESLGGGPVRDHECEERESEEAEDEDEEKEEVGAEEDGYFEEGGEDGEGRDGG